MRNASFRTVMVMVAATLCSSAIGIEAAGGDSSILDQWHGTWKGRLESYPLRQGAPEIEVVLEVGVGTHPNDGCLVWRTTYLDAGNVKQVKDYQMCRGENGRFFVDEGDDLILETSVLGGDIYSAFAVKGTTLFTHSRIDGEHLVQDIFFAGKEVTPVEDVRSFVGSGLQRIVFGRAVRSDTEGSNAQGN